MKYIITILLLLPLSAALAGEGPALPFPGVDLDLTNGNSAVDFFAKRQEDSACQTKLNGVKEQYGNAKSDLNNLVSNNASVALLNTAEEKLNEARVQYQKLLRDCGHCAIRSVEHLALVDGGTEHWYWGDGSCQVTDDNFISHFENRVSSLMERKMYTRHTGGFNNILDFRFIDPKSGKKLNVDAQNQSPYNAFLAIRGPYPLAFGFFGKSTFSETVGNELREFVYVMETEKPPSGFRFPRLVYDTKISGDKSATILKRLARVKLQWYVNSAGYMRYYMAADFGVDEYDYALTLARQIMMESLIDFSDR